MAWFTKDGQEVVNMYGKLRLPDGSWITYSQAASKGVMPDQESMSEAKQNGYTGLSVEQTGAKNFSKQQMADMPGAAYSTAKNYQWDKNKSLVENLKGLMKQSKANNTLTWENNPYAGSLKDPSSLLNPMKDVMGNYMPNYTQAETGLNELNTMAHDTNISPYAQALMDEQALQEQKSIGEQGSAATGEMQNAYSSLASQGGLDTGARTSLAKSNMLGTMLGRQGIAGQGMADRLGIRSEDLGRKYNLLTTMPSAYSNMATTGQQLWNPYVGQMQTEQQRTYDTNKYNIDQQIAELNNKRTFDLGIYSGKLDAWKLGKQLEGQARTGYAENPGTAKEDLYY